MCKFERIRVTQKRLDIPNGVIYTPCNEIHFDNFVMAQSLEGLKSCKPEIWDRDSHKISVQKSEYSLLKRVPKLELSWSSYDKRPLKQTETNAKKLLYHYGLYQNGWRFSFDNAKSRLGACHYSKGIISVSKPFLNIGLKPETLDNTLKHEIAHALAGYKSGHDNWWKAVAVCVGAKPERCANTSIKVKGRYELLCPNCNTIQYAHKVRSSKYIYMCNPCYKKGFKFPFVWRDIKQNPNGDYLPQPMKSPTSGIKY